jgi:2-methylcitrate dehydratase PrpD
LVTEEGVAIKDIEKVEIHVTARTLGGFVGARFDPAERRPVAGLFSIHFTAAAALLHGTVRPEHLTPEAMGDPRIASLLERIELVGSLPNDQRLTAEAIATLRDGSTRHVRVENPSGDHASAPLSRALLLEKFTLNLGFGLPGMADRAPLAIGAVQVLETADTVGDLMAALNPTFTVSTLIR